MKQVKTNTTTTISTTIKGGDNMINLTVRELKEIAKEKGVKGYSRMKKEELIKVLQPFFEEVKESDVVININDVMTLAATGESVTTGTQVIAGVKGGNNMGDIFVTNRAGIIFKVTGEREVNGNVILELINCRTGRKSEMRKEMVAILPIDVAQKMLQETNTSKENINNEGGDTMTQQTRFIVNVSQDLKNWYVYDRVDKKSYKALPGVQVQKVVKEYTRLVNGYKANIKIYGQQQAQAVKPAIQKVYTCKHCGKVVSQKEIDFLAKHQEALKVHASNAYRKVLCYDCQKKYNVLQAVKKFNAINKGGVQYMQQTKQKTLR